jgi:hypothetical protein
MPLAAIRISAPAEQDLLTIVEQPEEYLQEAYSRLAAIKGDLISPKQLRGALEQPLAPGVVRALIAQLIWLRSNNDYANVTPSETLGALSLGIKERNWPDDKYSKWERIAPLFEKFLSLDNIVITTKALELSSDFEHVLSEINIITDIRPVFSVNRDRIVGGIVCSRLRVKYNDEDGQRGLSISIDKDEIERLEKVCKDALRKIELATSTLKAGGSLPSFVSGEEYDDFA